MAYQALYRTYRPGTFDEVVGQEYIVKTLQNAVKFNKIAHAYLFCGPRGTGKTSIARILAKAVNCEAEDKPCNECASCKMIEEGKAQCKEIFQSQVVSLRHHVTIVSCLDDSHNLLFKN